MHCNRKQDEANEISKASPPMLVCDIAGGDNMLYNKTVVADGYDSRKCCVDSMSLSNSLK